MVDQMVLEQVVRWAVPGGLALIVAGAVSMLGNHFASKKDVGRVEEQVIRVDQKVDRLIDKLL